MIKIKYIKDIVPIEVLPQGNWIDLRCAEDTFIPEGSFAMISLGVAMKLPKGYEAIVAPRSSTFKNYGIVQTNSIGVIDSSYCGDEDEWKLPVYCFVGNTDRNGVKGTFIRKNDRICQFRLLENQPKEKLLTVEKLSKANRGGFGSTGKQ